MVVSRHTASEQESLGRAAVAAALQALRVLDPELHARFRVDKTSRSGQTAGSLRWCVAYQVGLVTNAADTTDTVTPRVVAQLTIQHRNSEAILDALRLHRTTIEATVGHPLSWLRGGESGGKLRSIIRAWQPLDGSAEEMGAWMAEELLRLRDAFRPAFGATGFAAP